MSRKRATRAVSLKKLSAPICTRDFSRREFGGLFASGYGLEFPVESGRDDVVVQVEASETLDDWSMATILFDSTVDFPPTADGQGWILINDARSLVGRRFYRIRVVSQ